ncbi:putative NAD(P)H quinone oxidoreductase, PIG3 family [Faunimonas pinastri]|uniref:Putative NAD(P)H quinone oxidoreductase, PIG3 family n=1 Tax=Faunimonas pinastri TaxID=1855383 RepID=A0A1H8Z873_9HYPH|nr:NAD(P)H-quinone oxidoreductase [Faunimonas pinastri]SEP59798.1 putative NAD(P)H quinone oxidoreductase, PIG3 family [Faunimonas pinastri]
MAQIPETMDVVVISEPGGPDVLTPDERPVPRPGPEEILIRVAAAGVNRPDVLQRQGKYAPPEGASDLPGLEVAGTVAAVGPGAERWQVGDQVVALLPGGGYAEYCTVHATNALPLPAPLSPTEAGGIVETVFTVWHNVFQRGALRPGEVFLVHGGTSGIGTTAIQLAKAFGCFVVATAGSEEKCQACRDLGADLAINYRTEDFVAVVKEKTGGRGADVILDMVGGSYVARNHDVAAEDGRIVQIAVLGGAKAEINVAKVMMKRLTHTGSTLRARSVAFKAELARSVEEAVWPLIAEGRFRPVIDATFPLAEAADAHRRMEEGSHVGKIILTVRD